MLIISRTPVRISFFGGGTDYPSYYRLGEGAVLGTTIDHYTYISVKTLKSRFFDHNIRIAYSRTELVRALDEIQHPSIRETLRYMGGDMEHLDIHIFSDLPARTGLGSSSSFTVGFLNALYSIAKKKASKRKLAREACHIEQELIHENVGSQDQFHAAYGGLNLIHFSAGEPDVIEVEPPTDLEGQLMLFFTGQTRHASVVVEEQIEKMAENKNHLSRMYDLVFEGKRALEENDLVRFGELLDRSWSYKRQLSSQVSNPEIDQAYQKAKEAGAIGGKLCGAGSGGFLLFLVPQEKQEAVRKALNLEEVEVRLEDRGSQIIYHKD